MKTVQSTKLKFDKNLNNHYPPLCLFQQLNINLSESLAGKYSLRNQKELDIRLFLAIYVGSWSNWSVKSASYNVSKKTLNNFSDLS